MYTYIYTCINASLLSNCGNHVFTFGGLIGAEELRIGLFELTLLLCPLGRNSDTNVYRKK
jgi:hypothetical protein